MILFSPLILRLLNERISLFPVDISATHDHRGSSVVIWQNMKDHPDSGTSSFVFVQVNLKLVNKTKIRISCTKTEINVWLILITIFLRLFTHRFELKPYLYIILLETDKIIPLVTFRLFFIYQTLYIIESFHFLSYLFSYKCYISFCRRNRNN